MDNSRTVIARSLMESIEKYAERALNGDTTLDQGMSAIGYVVDAYNEFFLTGRGKVSRKGE